MLKFFISRFEVPTLIQDLHTCLVARETDCILPVDHSKNTSTNRAVYGDNSRSENIKAETALKA